MAGGFPVLPDRMAARAWVTEASAKFREAMDAPLASAWVKRAMAAVLLAVVFAALGKSWCCGVPGNTAEAVDCSNLR